MRYNLRHLRVVLAVAETASVTRAAEACRVSQPAVTQAIAKFEGMVGAALFSRTPHGLFLTPAGEILCRRVRRVFGLIDPALHEVAPRLKLTVTAAQLEALIAVCDSENFTLAARRLGLAQPTVHRAVAQLEKEADRVLFERTAYGTMATRAAQLLARAARLAFLELEQAEAELAEGRSDSAGRLVIGSMPLSRSHILPVTIARFREDYPHVPIEVIEGRYSELLAGLRRGESDLLIGALREPVPIEDIEQQALFSDEAAIVCGLRHPLAAKAAITISDLAAYPWVVALKGTPIRAQFDGLFADQGLPAPRSITQSGSLILMRELLDISEHLGFVSGGQAEAEIRRGLLVRLPFDLQHTTRAIGVTTRKDWLPTKAQAQFLRLLQETASGAV